MTVFQIVAVILCLSAIGGYLNQRYIRFPQSIAHLGFALFLSFIIIMAGTLEIINPAPIRDFMSRIDFSDVVLHGMLAFLLFASALHINLDELKDVRTTVGTLATVGVVLSTVIVGSLVWGAAQLLGINLPILYAFLFGALISPTDPIAVLSILKQIGVSKKLYIKIGGESLLNDGAAIVMFILILSAITKGTDITPYTFAGALVVEGGGGILLGMLLGWISFRLIAPLDDYKTEIMITLGLVTGGYALAELLHVSAPLAMVAAGLLIGNHGRKTAMSDTTRYHLDIFWELVDEIMNAALFFLIGMMIMSIHFTPSLLALGLLAALSVLVGRFLSVGLPVHILRQFGQRFERGTVRLMTWGGLRGGISIAMALSLPDSPEKPIILAMTYMTVLTSLLGQGLTFRTAARRILS